MVWVPGILDGGGYRFKSAAMKSLRVPILYLSATRDSYGGAAAARQLYCWTTAAPLVLNLVDSGVLNHRVPRVEGVRAEECAELLRSFFRERRLSAAADR